MWKYPFAIVVTAGIITSSVYLYRHRDELFRPDVRKIGGTLIAFSVTGGDADDAFLARMQRRFDPRGSIGVVVRKAENGEVEILVPKGPAHDDLVERVKRLGARPGWVAFRTIATAEEDDEVTKQVLSDYAPGKNKKGPMVARPGPPVNALGQGDFPTSHPGDASRRYRWDRFSHAVLPTFGLDPASLASSNVAEKPTVERALATGSVFSPNALAGAHVLAARLPGVSDPVYFVLTREEDSSRAITSDNIRQAEAIKDRTITTTIRLRLDREGANRMEVLMERNQYGYPGRGMPARRGGMSGFVVVLVDDEIVTLPQLFRAAQPELQLSPGTTDDEAEDLACLMRGPAKGVRLGQKPTRVESIEPRR